MFLWGGIVDALFCKKFLLKFNNKWVKRGAVLLDATGAHYKKHLSIPLAGCPTCKKTLRVLPLDILPYKTYGISIIQLSLQSYVFHISEGLRATTATIKTKFVYAPHPSTLWRWSKSFGEKVLSRESQIVNYYYPPCSAILAQTTRKCAINAADIFIDLSAAAQLYITGFKYHSERRLDQLIAVVRILLVAREIFGNTASSTLLAWNEMLLSEFFVPAWNFPCKIKDPTLQHTRPP